MKKETKYTLLSLLFVLLLFVAGNMFGISMYFLRYIIVIPVITFFTARYFRIKHQSASDTQPNSPMAVQIGAKDLIWVVVWVIVVVIAAFALMLWSYAVGGSIFDSLLLTWSNLF